MKVKKKKLQDLKKPNLPSASQIKQIKGGTGGGISHDIIVWPM